MSKSFFNEKALNWDEIVNHDFEKVKYVIDYLPDLDEPEILDVGSGTGVLIPFLVEKFGVNTNITAVDYAEKMIEISRNKNKSYNINYCTGDIYSLQFPETYYDLIFCYSVFPHLQDKKIILEKFYRLLNTGGSVIIFHSQSRQTINNLHKNSGHEVERDNLPPGQEVARLAEEIGFSVNKLVDNEDLYLVQIKKTS